MPLVTSRRNAVFVIVTIAFSNLSYKIVFDITKSVEGVTDLTTTTQKRVGGYLLDLNRSHVAPFEAPADSMKYAMDTETPEEVQIGEVGMSPVESLPNYASGHFCASWERNLDEWWAANPEWGFETASNGYQCFKRYQGEKARFLRQVHDLQWNSSNCTRVHTRHMWSSGWGADFSNVVDGLLLGFEDRRPFQITFVPEGNQWWHYSAVKKDGDNPTCKSKDMFCYFLPLSNCEPGTIEFDNRYPQENKTNTLRRLWLREYATRQQQWSRHSVFQYIREKAPVVPTPCTAMHVRRSDVVLHDDDSRKYYPLSFYIRKAGLKRGENILLFTDDANAIKEAHEFHDEHNWIYLERKRHRGSEGSWENQTPSKNPKEEVIMLLTIFELAKRCDAFVHTYSNMADMIYNSMESTGRPIRRVRADEDLGDDRTHNENNAASESKLEKRLMARRRKTALEEGKKR